MRILLILLIAGFCFAQETVEFSAVNYGGNWQAADAALIIDIQRQMDGLGLMGSITFLYRYRYTVSDSAFPIIDLSAGVPIERWLEYKPPTNECPVELDYATVSKSSPSKVSHAIFSGWNGGAKPSGINPITDKQKTAAFEGYKIYKSKVDDLLGKNENKNWKHKGKNLNDKEKRGAAWKIVVGRLSESEITKSNK